MQQKWVGPYTVVASLGKGLYRIKNQSTDRILKKAVHSARLKEYSYIKGEPGELSFILVPVNISNTHWILCVSIVI